MGVFSFSRPQRNGRAEAQRSLCDPTPPLLRPSAPSLPPVHYQPPYLFRSIKDCRVVAGAWTFSSFPTGNYCRCQNSECLNIKEMNELSVNQ